MKDHSSQRIHTGLSCCDVAERATDYLEDRLPALTTSRIGLHLSSCAGCRTYVKQVDLVSSVLRSLPKLYPSPVNRLRLSERFAGRHAN